MLTHVEEQFDVLDFIRQREVCKETPRTTPILNSTVPIVNASIPEGSL